MADLIAREQCASDHKGNSFMDVPHQYSRRKQQPRLNRPISAASSVADDNFFTNLLVRGEDENLCKMHNVSLHNIKAILPSNYKVFLLAISALKNSFPTPVESEIWALSSIICVIRKILCK
jgi:hypothetical protein